MGESRGAWAPELQPGPRPNFAQQVYNPYVFLLRVIVWKSGKLFRDQLPDPPERRRQAASGGDARRVPRRPAGRADEVRAPRV